MWERHDRTTDGRVIAADVAGVDATTLVPAGGLGAVIVVLVGYLLKQLVADRADYRASIASERESVAAEQKRTAAAEAMAAAERARANEAQALVDREQSLRRAAEAAAAEAQGRIAVQQQMLAWYAGERARLQEYMPPPVGATLPDPPPPPRAVEG